MSELNLPSNNLEAEIAELSKQIEAKKRVLEEQSGVIPEDREMVAQAVAEHFVPTTPPTPTSVDDTAVPTSPVGTSPVRPAKPVQNYLDALDPETVAAINSYISMVPAEGIAKTVAKVQMESPFIMDAFHDALVTHLYEELKTRGIVK